MLSVVWGDRFPAGGFSVSFLVRKRVKNNLLKNWLKAACFHKEAGDAGETFVNELRFKDHDYKVTGIVWPLPVGIE